MTKNWKRGKNLDLWKELDNICGNRMVTWKKVGGHSGIPENEFVNDLAQFQSGVLAKEPKIEKFDINFKKSYQQPLLSSEISFNSEKLTHIDRSGNAQMVNIGKKNETKRIAKAQSLIKMKSETLAMIQDNSIPKGDVLATARLAGIMAAKQTDKLIPLCHQIPLESVTIEFTFAENHSEIIINSTVEANWKTGVEMEALTAVAVAGLTIYDMCKASDKRIIIGNIHLIEKSGGKSGEFRFD
jgi:cyclic pyranopterin phosphate synthase